MSEDGLKSVFGSRGLVFLLEDGLKLLGIGGWASYFVATCYASVVRTQRRITSEKRTDEALVVA